MNVDIILYKSKYNVNILKENIYECNHVIRRCAKSPPNYVPHINLLKELILISDSSKSIDGFNYKEIFEMIDDDTTSFYVIHDHHFSYLHVYMENMNLCLSLCILLKYFRENPPPPLKFSHYLITLHKVVRLV